MEWIGSNGGRQPDSQSKRGDWKKKKKQRENSKKSEKKNIALIYCLLAYSLTKLRMSKWMNKKLKIQHYYLPWCLCLCMSVKRKWQIATQFELRDCCINLYRRKTSKWCYCVLLLNCCCCCYCYCCRSCCFIL